VEILYLILVLLVVTRVFAELAERSGFPAIVGELVAGVALGFLLRGSYDTLVLLWSACQSETFTALVSLGMFFLMLLAGIRMEPLEFARVSKSAIGLSRSVPGLRSVLPCSRNPSSSWYKACFSARRWPSPRCR
jgi:Kef-type K+ transport system membrane component KefB